MGYVIVGLWISAIVCCLLAPRVIDWLVGKYE